jgi:hypothetical protein
LFASLPGVNTSLRTLVMDVSYTAVDVVSWQRAICLDILEKVEVSSSHPPRGVSTPHARASHVSAREQVVEYYESTVKSCNAEFQIPAVIKVRLTTICHRAVQRGRPCTRGAEEGLCSEMESSSCASTM